MINFIKKSQPPYERKMEIWTTLCISYLGILLDTGFMKCFSGAYALEGRPREKYHWVYYEFLPHLSETLITVIADSFCWWCFFKESKPCGISSGRLDFTTDRPHISLRIYSYWQFMFPFIFFYFLFYFILFWHSHMECVEWNFIQI